jgi:hypothetical protein
VIEMDRGEAKKGPRKVAQDGGKQRSDDKNEVYMFTRARCVLTICLFRNVCALEYKFVCMAK